VEGISPGALAQRSSIAGSSGNGDHLGSLALSVLLPAILRPWKSTLCGFACLPRIDNAPVHHLWLASTENRKCLGCQPCSRFRELPGGESRDTVVRRGARYRHLELPGNGWLAASGGSLRLACLQQATGTSGEGSSSPRIGMTGKSPGMHHVVQMRSRRVESSLSSRVQVTMENGEHFPSGSSRPR